MPNTDLPLNPDQAARAVAWNDDHWKGTYRAELLGFLRGAAAAAAAGFTSDDVQRVAHRQAAAGAAVDGMIGPGTMAVLLHGGLRFSREQAVPSDAVTIEFYPGEFEDLAAWRQAAARGASYGDVEQPSGAGRLYVKIGGNLVGMYAARGGPPITIPAGPGHTAGPTVAGPHTLGHGQPVITSTWPYSQLPWGAKIQKVGEDFQYQVPGSSQWHWATGPHCSLAKPLDPEDFTDLDQGDGCLLWNKNDFGKLGWNLLGTADFVHTTPDTEEAAAAGQPVVLCASHGCIHVVPAERDEMMARGYLQQGVRLVVKGYDEHLLPAQVRATSNTPG